MIKFTGKGVYGAVAIGKISVLKKNDTEVKRVRIEDTESEKQRYETAKALSITQLGEIYEIALK